MINLQLILYQKTNREFKNIHITISNFGYEIIEIQKGRLIIKMRLQEGVPWTFFDLITGNILHVYIKNDDFSLAYVMDYVKNQYNQNQYSEVHEREVLEKINEMHKNEIANIKESIRQAIQQQSEQSLDRCRIFSEALFLVRTDPSFMPELVDKFEYILKT